MGADIHTVLQRRNKDTGKWETVKKGVYEGRNYELFGALAGVRGGPKVFDCPEFLPPDFEVTNGPTYGLTYHEDYWMGDFGFGFIHLSTYLFDVKMSVFDSHALSPLTSALLDYIGGDEDPRDFRLVWGFDN